MSTMIFEVYDALKEAGASENKAKAAAEALADYENRFNRIDAKLEKLEAQIDMLKWMAGISIALMISVLALLLKQAL